MKESKLKMDCRIHAESLGGKSIPLTYDKGIPDRLVILQNGVTAYVEFKSDDGRLRPRQKEWRDWLLSAKQPYLLCDDLQQFKDFLLSLKK